MKRLSTLAKSPALQSPWARYGILSTGLGLWVYGLAEQLHSFSTTAIYLLLTLLMAAVALI